MNPPGSANAFGVGSSTTRKRQGRCGRSDARASVSPTRCTYAFSSASSTTPIDASTSSAACCPIAISWLSLMSASSVRPVTGLVAHPAANSIVPTTAPAHVRRMPPPERLMTPRPSATGVLAGSAFHDAHDRDLLHVSILIFAKVRGESVAQEGGRDVDAIEAAEQRAGPVEDVDARVCA